jgi:hypothetical protein
MLGVSMHPSRKKHPVNPATTPGEAGSNAGDFNSALGAAEQAYAEHAGNVNQWADSRSPYYDAIRDTQYQQALGQIDDQQREATQQNAFAQSRSGTRGGSADLGAQARIQQQGLEAQGKAYVAADASALKQQQIDADHAAWMKSQGYNYYQPVAKLGSFQADNLNRQSGMQADWRSNTTQARTDMNDATAGIQGAYMGGIYKAGMTQGGQFIGGMASGMGGGGAPAGNGDAGVGGYGMNDNTSGDTDWSTMGRQ